MPENIEDIPSRKITEEDKYYLEQAYKAPAEGIPRIEEAAKILLGATSGTSGLYLAAFKLVHGSKTAAVSGSNTGFFWLLPFLLWSASLIYLILVLLPQKIKTGRQDPSSWKNAFQTVLNYKYQRLRIGAVFFILGILSGALPFLF